MRHRPLNDFALALADLLSAVEWETDTGSDIIDLQKTSDAAEQAIFELLVRNGYSLVEARTVAMMVVNTIRNGR